MEWLVVITCLALAALFGCIASLEEGHGRWVAAVIAAVFSFAALVIPGMGSF